MTTRPLYQHIAARLSAAQNCRAALARDTAAQMPAHELWLARHLATIAALVKEYTPSGGGIDNGTIFDEEESTPEKLVFHVNFHHMNPNGYYDGWTQHVLTVRASLAHGFDLQISGRDRNQIKDYLGELYHHCFAGPVENSRAQALALAH